MANKMLLSLSIKVFTKISINFKLILNFSRLLLLKNEILCFNLLKETYETTKVCPCQRNKEKTFDSDVISLTIRS